MLVATLAFASGLQAAPRYLFDFNGMTVGSLYGQADDSPNASGGWVGKSGVPAVVAGHLTVPAGTNYSLNPALTAGRFSATRTDTAFRGQFHRVTPASGVMWISALLRAVDGSAAAVVIDGGDTNNDAGWTLNNKGGFGIRPNAAAGTTQLFWSDNLTNLSGSQSMVLPVNYANQTVLVVARIQFGGSGNDVDVWVNPVLTTAAALGTAGDLQAATNYSSMAWVGAGAVNTGGTGYTVEFDNLAFSNNPFEEAAFAEVTGLPAPPDPPTVPRTIALGFDFNDLTAGALDGQIDDSTNRIGTWTGGSSAAVVAGGSLAAPSGTSYGISAGGIAASAVLNGAGIANVASFHRVNAGDGVMWFSALLRVADRTAAAVLLEGSATDSSLAGKAGFGIRPDATSGTSQLFWSEDLTNLGGSQAVTLPGSHSGQTVLIVGRVNLAAAGPKVDLWLNPSLTNRAALGTTGHLEATTTLTQMEWIGLGVVDDGSPGYSAIFDNLFFSNDPDENAAFIHVTGRLPDPVAGAADVNGNGLSDLSELLYPALSTLQLTADADGDGLSNAGEAAAQTDPLDPASTFRGLNISRSTSVADAMEFTFQSVPGVRYQIQVSEHLTAWAPLGSVITAVGTSTTALLPQSQLPSPTRSFARAAVAPALDSDGDGLEDALEAYLGFATNSTSSVRAAESGGDRQQFINLMSGGSLGGGFYGSGMAGVISPEHASRFLAQASFGPTLESITALRSLGPNAYASWIDQQVATPVSFLRTYVDMLYARRASDAASGNYAIFPHFVTSQSSGAMYRENVNTAWMRHALFAPDELRQRMAWALSQIVVIGPRCNSYGIAAADWYDTILQHSFGSYRELLHEIALHPWMGFYLSHLGNRKADPTINRLPDENFAREIMQLFSIGLWELNMDGTQKLNGNGDAIPTYTNKDIEELARVFTGLELQTGVSGQDVYAAAPMRMIESRHDTGDTISAGVYGAAEKRFLGATLPAFANDPGRTGLDDVSEAVDVLINHPSCPPFICKNLIQQFVTSNPTPAYVARVATVFANDGTGMRGNLAATIKAILLDPEARELSAMLDPAAGRLKGPMQRTVAVARAFGAGAATPALYDLSGIQFWSPKKEPMFADFLEYPFEYPSVFNFYEPGYSRPGEVRDSGLLSPEFEIMNALTATTLPNRLWWFLQNGFHNGNPAVTPEFRLALDPQRSLSTNSDLLLDRVNLLLCHGQLSPAGRASLRQSLDHWSPTDPNWRTRTELAIYLALVSPDAAVLK